MNRDSSSDGSGSGREQQSLTPCSLRPDTSARHVVNPYANSGRKQSVSERWGQPQEGCGPLGGGTATSACPGPGPEFLLLVIFHCLSLENTTVFLGTRKAKRIYSSYRLDWRVTLKKN